MIHCEHVMLFQSTITSFQPNRRKPAVLFQTNNGGRYVTSLFLLNLLF